MTDERDVREAIRSTADAPIPVRARAATSRTAEDDALRAAASALA